MNTRSLLATVIREASAPLAADIAAILLADETGIQVLAPPNCPDEIRDCFLALYDDAARFEPTDYTLDKINSAYPSLKLGHRCLVKQNQIYILRPDLVKYKSLIDKCCLKALQLDQEHMSDAIDAMGHSDLKFYYRGHIKYFELILASPVKLRTGMGTVALDASFREISLMLLAAMLIK